MGLEEEGCRTSEREGGHAEPEEGLVDKCEVSVRTEANRTEWTCREPKQAYMQQK